MYGTTPVLRYVFPTYRGLVSPYGEVTPKQALDLAKDALLTGEPLLLIDARMEKAAPRLRDGVPAIVELKRRVDPLLYAARYLDAVGLSVPHGLRASVYVAPGRVLVPFARRDPQPTGQFLMDTRALGVTVQGTAQVWVAGSEAATEGTLRVGEDGVVELPVPAAEAGVVVVE